MWLGCSGSLIPNIFAKDDSGEDAAYGTVAHSVGESWLKTSVKPVDMLGKKEWVEAGEWGYIIEIDEVMMDHVQRYVDWCALLPGEHFVETRVDFSSLTPIPNQGGTADHVACTYGKMVITDLKMGKGVHVYAKNNSQALLYALGFFFEWDWLYDFQEFEIRIAQPRRDNMDTWTVDRAYLLKFAEYVKERARAAWVPNAPRTPSAEACQWCRVQSTCAALAMSVFDMTAGAFEAIGDEVSADDMVGFKDSLALMASPDVVDHGTLSTSDMALLYGWRGTVERFFSTVERELSIRAARGETIPMWKLVESRSRRVFSDKNAAAQKLIALGCKPDEVIFEKVVSPAQAETLLRKAGLRSKDLPGALHGLVHKPPGKPTLARSHDRRPALTDITADVFSDTTAQPDNPDDEEY